VISADENSNKLQKNHVLEEKSVEDLVILRPMAQAVLVNM
jgi:hypothetical protein